MERLSASLHLVGARPAGKRTVFVEDGCVFELRLVWRFCVARRSLRFCPFAHLITPRGARRSEEALAAMPAAAAGRGGGGGGAGSSDDEDSDGDGDGDGRGAPAPQSARGCVPGAAPRRAEVCARYSSVRRAAVAALAVADAPTAPRSAHRELSQRRERAAKLARLAAEMASAKAASGKGTKRKLPPVEGAPPQYKFKTERKK